MPPAELCVAGTGSFSAEICELATEAGFRVSALVELLDESRVGSRIHGLPVVAAACPPDRSGRVLVGVGGDRRGHVERLRSAGWSFETVVHPRAHVAESAHLAEGSIVLAGAVIGACARLDEHVLVSRGALIGHHTVVGSFSTLNPGANVAGNVLVGSAVSLGMGCVVTNGVRIGSDAIVAAGAVVLEDVPEGRRVQGVPARLFGEPAVSC